LILSAKRLDIFKNYWRGIFAGAGYVFSKTYNKVDDKLLSFKYFLMAWTDPVCWLVDKDAEKILDVGAGQGLPMQLIKMRMKPKKVVAIDLFEPYIDEVLKKGIYDEYIKKDIRNISFKKDSFDVVIALQVLEHLKKDEALKLLDKLERIAKKQVIVATPIGEMYHPAVDNNPLQLHRSSFVPEEFIKRGYRVLKFGRKSILGEYGMVHKVRNDFLRKIIYTGNILLTPLYYLVQPLSDYHLYAYKNFDNDV